MNNDGGYGSRKFLLAAAGLVISSVLLWFGKLTGGDYVTFNSILAGAYMAANTAISYSLKDK